MNEIEQKLPPTEEQKKNNRFSFVVGIVIVIAIMIVFALLFNK